MEADRKYFVGVDTVDKTEGCDDVQLERIRGGRSGGTFKGKYLLLPVVGVVHHRDLGVYVGAIGGEGLHLIKHKITTINSK